VPFFGDILSSSYFLTQDAIDCAARPCDPINIGLDVIGAVPGVPNLGGGARAASRAAGFLGGSGLVTKGGRHEDALVDLARAKHTVYTLVDASGNAKYAGRTTRSAEVRLAEHQRGLRAKAFENLRIGETFEDLTHAEARGLEHRLFTRLGGTKVLLNLISPISIFNLGKGHTSARRIGTCGG